MPPVRWERRTGGKPGRNDMPKTKTGYVKIIPRGKGQTRVAKEGSSEHRKAAQDRSGYRVTKVVSAGTELTAAQAKALGIKAQPQSDDKAQSKGSDK